MEIGVGAGEAARAPAELLETGRSARSRARPRRRRPPRPGTRASRTPAGGRPPGRNASGSAATARSRSVAQGPGDPASATTWMRPAWSWSISTGSGVVDASMSTTGSMSEAGAAAASSVANAVAAPLRWLTIATRAGLQRIRELRRSGALIAERRRQPERPGQVVGRVERRDEQEPRGAQHRERALAAGQGVGPRSRPGPGGRPRRARRCRRSAADPWPSPCRRRPACARSRAPPPPRRPPGRRRGARHPPSHGPSSAAGPLSGACT